MTLRQCCIQTINRLATKYSRSEAQWMVRIIFDALKGWTQVDLVVKANDEISDYLAEKVTAITDRLMTDEPIQYILGSADFYGLKFHVDPRVLIPRRETEQIVDLVVAEAHDRSDLRILDLCTGSGCIAIALARTLRFPIVDAVDVSPKALEVARDNAVNLKARVNFMLDDVLNSSLAQHAEAYDIIVSNPPYVTEHEKAEMEPNVLAHEPHLALFVPDTDPLRFYRAIQSLAQRILKPYGALLFEINPLYASDLTELMTQAGWVDVTIVADIHSRKRFLTARSPK